MLASRDALTDLKEACAQATPRRL